MLSAAVKKAGINPSIVGDVVVGNVLPAGGGASAARMAALHAGIPNTVPISTTNRQCASGLQAVNIIAGEILSGQIDVGIGAYDWLYALCVVSCSFSYDVVGAGVESMTFGFGGGAMPDGYSEAVLSNRESEDCLIPMGITSENVAADFKISRQVQDDFAAKSFQKAAAAQKAGKFKDEIVPLKVKIVDPKTEKEVEIIVDRDDGVRDGVTAESLGKLKPAFTKDGSTHAGAHFFTAICGDVADPPTIFSRQRVAGIRRCRRRDPGTPFRCKEARSTHRGQVCRCLRSWRAPAHHGCRPGVCHPEGA